MSERLARDFALLLALGAVLGLSGCGVQRTLAQTPVAADPGNWADVNPCFSHSGHRIAFLRTWPDGQEQLCITDADLVRSSPLLEKELLEPDRGYSSTWRRYDSPETLAWSPDDGSIAFERVEWFTFENGDNLPGTALWEISLRTGAIQPIALHPRKYLGGFYYFRDPQWSPDGRYIAFCGEGMYGERALFVRPVTAPSPVAARPRYDFYSESDWPAWQPMRPHRLAFRQSIRRSAAVVPVETLRYLTPGDPSVAAAGELWRLAIAPAIAAMQPQPGHTVVPRIGQPAWSRHGFQLAFTVTPDATDYSRYEIWTLDLQSGKAGPAVVNLSGCLHPVWVDSNHIGAIQLSGHGWSVVEIDLRSRTVRKLGRIDSADCSWSPDRSRIVYASRSPGPGPLRPTTLRLFYTGLHR
ncbi:MAG: PD40 domain-containing protein [Armatimonadetes bacterium]|nr:PD40 domain-containing protein [Armatimonadota bacterium]MDE2206506.1 PD40 domain-containing protein [Armatimonadota bacterium]